MGSDGIVWYGTGRREVNSSWSGLDWDLEKVTSTLSMYTWFGFGSYMLTLEQLTFISTVDISQASDCLYSNHLGRVSDTFHSCNINSTQLTSPHAPFESVRIPIVDTPQSLGLIWSQVRPVSTPLQPNAGIINFIDSADIFLIHSIQHHDR